MNLKGISLDYFKAFSLKDISVIKIMLDEKVELKDWTINVKGRDSVLDAISLIFQEFDLIRIDVKEIYQEGFTIIAKLDIKLDDHLLSVVDILNYSEENKILSIHAYKGS